MGFRFQKRIKLGKNLGINISKSGFSPSYRTKQGSVSTKGYSIRTGIKGVTYRKTFSKAKNSGCLLVLVFLIMILISCQWDRGIKGTEQNNSNIQREIPISTAVNSKTEDTTIVKVKPKMSIKEKEVNILEEFGVLYKELLQFKSNADFKKYGFSSGGPYYSWLKRVEKLKNHSDSKKLLKKGFVAGELETLGLEYVISKGKETELSKFFNEIFSAGLK